MDPNGIANFLQQAWVALQLPFYSFFGAFVLYVLNRLQNKIPFSLFNAIGINVASGARPSIVLWDMVISSLIGACVVVPLTSPGTAAQAVVAGLGMTGILAAAKKD